MQRFGANEIIPAHARGAALAMGKFDGVHLGHRAVIASAGAAAEQLGAPVAAPLFEPHPRRAFEPNAPPFLLQTLDQRARALEDAGVGLLFEFELGKGFLSLSDRAFAERILAERLGVRHVSTGANF